MHSEIGEGFTSLIDHLLNAAVGQEVITTRKFVGLPSQCRIFMLTYTAHMAVLALTVLRTSTIML